MTSIQLELTAIGLALVALGCASTGGAYEQQEQQHVSVDGPTGRFDILLTREQYLSTDTLAVPPSRAWPALVQTYAGFGVQLQGADPEKHMIATQYVRAHGKFAGDRLSRWLDCGSSLTGDIATNYEITLRLGTLIDTSVVGRSIIRTTISATAKQPGNSTNPLNCASSGALEKQIAALVASKAS